MKWTLAIIALAGVVAYALAQIPRAFDAGIAFGDEAGGSETAAASDAATAATASDAEAAPSASAPAIPSGPVTNDVAPPQVDFALSSGVVTAVTAEAMTVGAGGQDGILVSFPLIEGNPDCVQSARLELLVVRATPTEFAAYPSSVVDPASLAEGALPPSDPVINVDGPPLSFTDGTPGRLEWEVGDLYRAWAKGEAYAGGSAPPVGTPRFTLVVRPTDGGATGRQVVFASSETGDQGPTLAWTGLAGCGQPAA